MTSSFRGWLVVAAASATAACGTDARPSIGNDDAAVIIPGTDGALPTDNGCRMTYCAVNGACTDTRTDPLNCGACGNSCAALAHVDPSLVRCVSSACVVAGGCAAGWASCDGRDDNGCETDLNDPAHCGACDTACAEPRPYCER
ncbi:MAG: hypothetical protein R3A52_22885, partial [Polyangiales bacterium]